MKACQKSFFCIRGSRTQMLMTCCMDGEVRGATELAYEEREVYTGRQTEVGGWWETPLKRPVLLRWLKNFCRYLLGKFTHFFPARRKKKHAPLVVQVPFIFYICHGAKISTQSYEMEFSSSLTVAHSAISVKKTDQRSFRRMFPLFTQTTRGHTVDQ